VGFHHRPRLNWNDFIYIAISLSAAISRELKFAAGQSQNIMGFFPISWNDAGENAA
jgi:hypothetical protein